MRRLGFACGAFALVWSGAATAALGNLAYQANEVGVPLASFNEATFTGPPGGSNTVLMLRDYMVVMGSHDSGVKDGPLHVFDVSNPRAPKLLKRFTSAETGNLRELHAMPVALLDGKDILVFPSITGVSFFDFTDPMNPKAVGQLALEGVNGGDYDNAAWMLSWAWPYVYVGGTGNGIYVVDAHDPSQPKLVTRIQTGELGGFRIGPVYAAGNYIVASGMDASPTKVAVLDAGEPDSPFLLTNGSAPASMYSSVVIGDRIYGTGEGGNYSFMKWSPDAVEVLGGKAVKMGADKGGYCTYQDAFIFCGQSSEGYRKIDVSNESDFKEVEKADIPVDGADTDFATVLGNLIYLGNDHGSGAAFFVHDAMPDKTPPKLLGAYPQDGDVQQPLGSRVTLFFSDEIDIGSIGPESIIVRPVGGAAIAGVFSHSSFNAVSFGAKEPLTDDTTYEVVVVKDGLKDLAKNPIGEESVVRFSTGETVDEPVGQGGSGGMSGAGGSAPSSGGMSSAGSANAGAPGAGTMASGGSGTSGRDAGAGVGNEPTTPVSDDGGCGCTVAGGSKSSGAWLLAALAVVGLGAVRRRRS
jgi:MYXO-CTERM domain-containing protein